MIRCDCNRPSFVGLWSWRHFGGAFWLYMPPALDAGRATVPHQLEMYFAPAPAAPRSGKAGGRGREM